MEWTCSGVVISKDAVLTAAHCVDDNDAVRLRFAYDGKSNTALAVKDSNDIMRVRVADIKPPGSLAVKVFEDYCNRFGSLNSFYNGLNDLFFSDYRKNGHNHKGDLALIFYKGGLPKGVKIVEWIAVTSSGLGTQKCGNVAQISLLIHPYATWIQQALQGRRAQKFF